MSNPDHNEWECEASEAHDLARSVVSSCKQSRKCSSLETAIFLVRQVLDQYPKGHLLRSRALDCLCVALSLRFSQAHWEEDAAEVMDCLAEIVECSVNPVNGDGESESEDQSEMLHLASSLLNEFSQSVEQSSIDTAVLIFREVLESRLHNNCILAPTLFDLSDSLVVRFHLTGQREDLNEAITLLQQARDLLPPPNPERFRYLLSLAMGHWLRLHLCGHPLDGLRTFELFHQAQKEDTEARQLYNTAFHYLEFVESSGDLAQLDTAVALSEQSLSRRPAFHPHRSISLHKLAHALFLRFRLKGHLPDLEDSITLNQEALGLRPVPHPSRAESLNNLAGGLWERYKHKSCLPDLENAIVCHREAIELRPAPHPDRPSSLINIAGALVIWFEQKGHLPDLEEAISFYREAVQLCSASHSMRSGAYNSLSNALRTRFEHTGHLPDIEDAIVCSREAIVLRPAPHPLRSGALHNLSISLSVRYGQTGHLPDLEESITICRDALELCPTAHTLRFNLLDNLANMLLARFKHMGRASDLGDAIASYREALGLCPATHSDRSQVLNSLSEALSTRFEQNGQPSDLDDSITFCQEALQLPDRSSSQYISIETFASTLFARFQQEGHISDLEEAIARHRTALALCPPSPLRRSLLLSHLGNALFVQFQHKGHLPDLEDAIASQREALDSCFSPLQRSSMLKGLANSIYLRFQQKGHAPDLEEAISLNQAALDLCPALSPSRLGMLWNLALTISKRFEQRQQLPDLEYAIALNREALAMSPIHTPVRPGLLVNLATGLCRRSRWEHDLSDLNNAIAFYLEALQLYPDQHPDRCSALINLSSALYDRSRWKNHLPDLNEAIALQRDGLRLLPIAHPTRRTAARNLGTYLIRLHSVTRDPDHLEDAMTALRESATCTSGSLLEQFDVSRVWASHATDWNHSSTLDAFQHTIDFLSQLSSLDLSLQERQEVLANTTGIASEACSWAVRAGLLEKAVEFLSAARVVFWSQAHSLRTPLEELRSAAPLLADKLHDISADLERSSRRNPDLLVRSGMHIRSIEQEASRCRRLNEERIRILDVVRKLPGFEDFMLPRSFDRLKYAASDGPVVIVSASNTGCDGLLLTQGSVKHIPFPIITSNDVYQLGYTLQAALSATDIRSAVSDTLVNLLNSLSGEFRSNRKGIRVPEPGCGPNDLFQSVLAILWVSIARPVVDALNLQVSDMPPRLWWCPTGPFAFLPIHAAGIYDGENDVSLSDYVISSYTPTLDTLITARVLPPPTDSFSMLTVIEAATPGQSKLPYALKELQMIQKHVPNKWLANFNPKDQQGEETPSYVEYVSSSLINVSFAHFACHGSQNLINPLKSALFLSGGQLTMAKIMEHPLRRATLAFLNACETAKGDDSVPDEAMHLSAALLFAGFRGVVGTMWSIYDPDAPIVADVFYGHTFRKGADTYPDPTEAAYALHLAAKKLRIENKVNFRRWVPFIHLGA